MNKPPYVQFGSLMVPTGPFVSQNVKLDGFVALADGAKLDALCQRLFTEVSGGAIDILAVGDRVILTWGQIDAVASMTEPFKSYGSLPEPQVCIWVPICWVDRDDRGTPKAKKVGVFLPFIWVDNAMSLATGRELFGYPKAWGYFGFPGEGEAPRTWTCDAFGLETYAPDSHAGRHPLLEVIEGDAIGGQDHTEHDSIWSLARELGRRMLDRHEDEMKISWSLVKDLWHDAHDKTFPQIYLKQIHSVEDVTEAALQQITQAIYRVPRVSGKVHTQQFTLNVRDMASHPVIAELGLESQVMELGFTLDMDFTVGEGSVLWDAAAQ